ncbi:hypothetical protein ACWFPY_22015 [Nocardia fluminea]
MSDTFYNVASAMTGDVDKAREAFIEQHTAFGRHLGRKTTV